MRTQTRTAVRRLAVMLLFLAFALVVTVTGFYLSWTQIHSPHKATALAGAALIWPYAIVNRAFHLVLGPNALPTSVYEFAFCVGSAAQTFYLFGVMSLTRIVVPPIVSRFRPGPAGQREDRRPVA